MDETVFPRTVFLNGRYVPYKEAVIPVEDRGFLFSDSIYEVVRCYGGRLFQFDAHMERFIRSAASLELPMPYSPDEWRNIAMELINRNELRDATVYFQVSRGMEPRQHLYGEGLTPTAVVIARHAERPDPAQWEDGVSCVTAPDNRWGICHIKTTGLMPNILARREARRMGAFDAIFVRDGFVTEATASNVFCAIDGVAYTYPLANILPGVTRRAAMGLLSGLGIEVREEAVTLDRFRRADEIWLTGTVLEAVGVVTLDGRPVGGGTPGPITRSLRKAFHELVDGPDAEGNGAALQDGRGGDRPAGGGGS